MQPAPARLRSVRRVVTSHRQREGAGFVVRRPLPSPGLEHVDPFLLIDEMGPVDYRPGEAVGAPDHPHRGFETVTYVLEGEGEHEDSAGHRGVIGPGAVQWMTAGSGVIHSEMPSRRLQREGGRMHGFQVWVNLPARDKMIAPRYQELAAGTLPRVASSDGRVEVRVVAGEALGATAAIDTRTPITYLDFTLRPGASVDQPLATGHTGLLYVFAGSVEVGAEGRALADGQMAILGDGEAVRLRVPEAASAPARLLLLGGQPLGEPVARYGPFVMNAEAELQQAFLDYQAGRMGAIRRRP